MKSLLAADVEEELCRQPITDADMEKMPRCRVYFLHLGRTPTPTLKILKISLIKSTRNAILKGMNIKAATRFFKLFSSK
jgi:hypothetical protein